MTAWLDLNPADFGKATPTVAEPLFAAPERLGTPDLLTERDEPVSTTTDQPEPQPRPARRGGRRHAARIQRLHEDGTVCEHRVSSRGKPLEEVCTGVARYQATCKADRCTWSRKTNLRVYLEDLKAIHLREVGQ